jgi:hypothetical protein
MSNETYNLVKDSTGGIVGQITGDVTLDTGLLTNNTPVGHTTYLGQATDTVDNLYYPSGTRTTRPLFTTSNSWNATTITANGTSTATFGSSLPNPTSVVVEYTNTISSSQQVLQSLDTTDGSFSLNTTLAGTYLVSFTAFPYQKYSQIITAT